MVNSPSQPFRTKHLIWFRDRAKRLRLLTLWLVGFWIRVSDLFSPTTLTPAISVAFLLSMPCVGLVARASKFGPSWEVCVNCLVRASEFEPSSVVVRVVRLICVCAHQ
jgi:hypothetical protein